MTGYGLIGTGITAVAAIAILLSQVAAAGREGALPRSQSAPVTLSAGSHLFIDDYLVARQWNLKRVVNQPTKLPEPIVDGTSDKCFTPYVSVVRDAKTKLFRMWYNTSESPVQSHLSYMESNDGIHWIRPHRVLEDPAHIQFGASVINDPANEPDPQKRYKFAWWADGGMRIAVSPDGINWKLISEAVVLPHNHDINSIHWDPIRKRYIALVSVNKSGEGWRSERRIPHQSVSDDLVHWTEPRPVIVPDEKDQGETQFYCMSGVIARGGLLIGLVKVLRDEVVAEGAPNGAQGIGFTQLAWSRDGEHWTREHEPFLERSSKQGDWDHAMAWGACQLIVGDETYVYYGGYRWGHKWERFIDRQIGLARMPKDRYVYRQAGDQQGGLRTPIVVMNAKRMTVNADVSGLMRVRILDRAGKPIQGFGWNDIQPITGDSVCHPVTWKRPLSELNGKQIQLEFGLRNARIFGFELLSRPGKG